MASHFTCIVKASAASISLVVPLLSVLRRNLRLRSVDMRASRDAEGRLRLRADVDETAELHLVLHEESVDPASPLGRSTDLRETRLEGTRDGGVFVAAISAPAALVDLEGDFYRREWMVRLRLKDGIVGYWRAAGADVAGTA